MTTIGEIKEAFPRFEWEDGWSDDSVTTWYGVYREDQPDEQTARVEHRSHGIVVVEIADITGSGRTLQQAKRDINDRLRERLMEIETALTFASGVPAN